MILSCTDTAADFDCSWGNSSVFKKEAFLFLGHDAQVIAHHDDHDYVVGHGILRPNCTIFHSKNTWNFRF